MKVDTTDPLLAKVSLETEAGYYAFKAGLDDRRKWVLSPETLELAQFVNDNKKHAQIAINYKDNWTRIK